MYLEKFRLDNRTALITGAARGIGFAAAEALSEAGAEVILTDMDGSSATAACAKINARGGKASSYVLDVTDPRQVEAVHGKITEAGKFVDILVNNAGIAISFRPAETMDDQTWLKVLDVNLNGVFWCCRTFGMTMLEKGQGEASSMSAPCQRTLSITPRSRPSTTHQRQVFITSRARWRLSGRLAVCGSMQWRQPTLKRN